ncbi:MAG: hypothetical protein AB7K04_08625 [Pseudorhodoplanes sp.]
MTTTPLSAGVSRSRIDVIWIWFAVALLVMMIGRAVGPRIADADQAARCVVNAHLPGPFGLSLNCDSPEFLRLAHTPSALLEPKNTRQARPGMIFLAAILAAPLEPIAGLARKMGTHAERSDIDPQRISNAIANFLPAFAAYIFLNVVLLALSFYFLLKLVERVGMPSERWGKLAVLSVAFLLFATYPVNTFLWTPHTQMLNTLIPILAIYVALRAFDGAMENLGFAIVMGLVVGLGNLSYGFFAILAPCLAVPALLRWLRDPRGSTFVRLAINFAVFAALVILPYAIWYGIVVWKNGAFYHHEIEAFPQHTWVKTTLAQGFPVFWNRLVAWSYDLLENSVWQARALGVMTLWILIVWLLNRRPLGRSGPLVSLLVTAVLVSVLVYAFYLGVGLAAPRLAYSVVVPLIAGVVVIVARVADNLPARQSAVLALGCAAIALERVIVALIYDL